MRRTGRIAVGLGLVAGCIGMLTVAFYPVDRLRPAIEARLSDAAGAPVTLGKLSLSILGGIGVHADGLQVGPPVGRSAGFDMTLSAATARVGLSLGALAGGQTAIRGIDLRRAEIRDIRGLVLTDGSVRTQFSRSSEGHFRSSGSFEGRPVSFPSGQVATGNFEAELVEDRLEFSHVELRIGGGSFRASGTVEGVRTATPRVKIAGEAAAGATRGSGSAAASFAANETEVRLDVTFSDLRDEDLAPLMAFLSSRGAHETGGRNPEAPRALHAIRVSGQLRADRATIASLQVQEFHSDLSFENGRFALTNAEFGLYGGKQLGQSSIDLSDSQHSFRIDSQIEGVDMRDLQGALVRESLPVLEGTGQLDVRVTGNAPAARIEPTSLRGTLQLAIKDGRISNLGVLAQISALAARADHRSAPEDTPFHALTAVLRLEGDHAFAESVTVRSDDLNLDGQGSIGLNGALDLSLTASLAPAITASLEANAPSLRHWVGPDHRLAVPLRLAGSLQDPRVSMDVDRAASEGLARFLEEKGKRGVLRRLLGGR